MNREKLVEMEDRQRREGKRERESMYKLKSLKQKKKTMGQN